VVPFGHAGGVSGAVCALSLAKVSGVGLLGLLQGLARFLQVLVTAKQTLCRLVGWSVTAAGSNQKHRDGNFTWLVSLTPGGRTLFTNFK